MQQNNVFRAIHNIVKLMLFIFAIIPLPTKIEAAELVFPIVGTAVSKTVSNYVDPYLTSLSAWLQSSPKTFDNEFNEAVCRVKEGRGTLQTIIEKSLKEFDEKFNLYPLPSKQDVIDFNIPILRDLANSALIHWQRYELALVTLDFLHHTKTLLEEKWKELEKGRVSSSNPRYLGQMNAKQLQFDQNQTMQEAQNALVNWKLNLLAALHQTYPYTSEGGLIDKGARSYNRRRERSNYWGIERGWFGNAEVPKLKTYTFTFIEDSSIEMKLVKSCYDVYTYTVDLVLKRIDSQVGPVNLDYISGVREKFHELFPEEKLVSSEDLKLPKFLTDYIDFLKSQQKDLQAVQPKTSSIEDFDFNST